MKNMVLPTILKTSAVSAVATIIMTGCGGSGPSIPSQPAVPAPSQPVISGPIPGVDYTDPAQFMQTISSGIPAHLSQVNAQVAHDNGFTGGNLSETTTYKTVSSDKSNRNLQTVIAVLDSGINATHEDFNSTGKIVGFKDFTSTGSSTPYDDDGHGTMVSHIAAGNRQNQSDSRYGMAYGAQLLVGQVFENGSAYNTTLENAINWVSGQADTINVNNVKKVTSLNLSMGTTDSSYVTSSLKSAVLNAMDKGISVVVAAGNDGLSCSSATSSNCSFPAAMPFVDTGDGKTVNDFKNKNGAFIVVGSVDSSNNISSFSNRAGIMKDMYLVAPGEQIIGASYKQNNGYLVGSGTSFAAPIVTGAMALMQQKWPYITGRQQASVLFATATDLGAPGVDDVYGNGLLNLTAAFNPVGTVAIPTATSNVSSGATSAKGLSLSGTKIQTSSALASFGDIKAIDNTIVIDSFSRDFKVSMTNYASISGETPFNVDDVLKFRYGKFIFGVDQARNIPLIGYNFGNETELSVGLDGKTMLGMTSGGALDTGSGQTVYVYGKKELYNEDDMRLTLEGTYAYGKTSGSDNSIISDISDVHAIGGRVKASYMDVGVGYEVPLRAIRGEAKIKTPTDIDNNGNVITSTYTASLVPNSFQQVVSTFYQKRFSNLSVLAQLSHTFDAYGVNGLSSNDAKFSLSYWY
jgi:subtilisin family serine protease